MGTDFGNEIAGSMHLAPSGIKICVTQGKPSRDLFENGLRSYEERFDTFKTRA